MVWALPSTSVARRTMVRTKAAYHVVVVAVVDPAERLKRSNVKKKWYKSRTVWLNIATFVAGAGPLVANFTGLVSPLAFAILLTFVGAANIALRLLTDQGVEM